MCVAGARWVQSDLLEKYPDTDVRVYAVSFRMLASDRLAGWLVKPGDLLSDPRVTHDWDEGKLVGRWYDEHVTRVGESGGDRAEWDAYFLYGPDATWGDGSPREISWGRTIVASRAKLLHDFTSLVTNEAALHSGEKAQSRFPPGE